MLNYKLQESIHDLMKSCKRRAIVNKTKKSLKVNLEQFFLHVYD